MMQALHIFRKDVRHLWRELTLYGVVLVAFRLVAPQTWEGSPPADALVYTFSILLKALIAITMIVIIARLVHDESLVGDEQFWITRPYIWTSLFTAKFFFILICIVAPFVAMQWSLLLHAGLNPLAAIPGLLLTLLYFALWNWLPIFAVATVTATLSSAFMSLVAAVMVWLGVLTIVGSTAGPRTSPSFAFETFSILSAVLLIGIVLYQYAVRNTERSRIALVATTILLLGLYCCFVEVYWAGPVNALIRHKYPISPDRSLRLAFDPSPFGYDNEANTALTWRKLLALKLPIQIEGLGPSFRVGHVNASFTIDAPGFHYDSPWRPAHYTGLSLSLLIPRGVLDRVHTADVRMHLTLVAQRLLPDAPQTVTTAEHFRAPNNGICILLNDRSGGNLVCRYAFRSPPPTTISGLVAMQPCGRPAPMRAGTAVIRSIPPGTNPDPVVQEPLRLGGTVCPGTRLTFVTYRSAGNFRLELDIPRISLDHYSAP